MDLLVMGKINLSSSYPKLVRKNGKDISSDSLIMGESNYCPEFDYPLNSVIIIHIRDST